MSTPPPYTDIDAAMAVYVEDDLSGEDSPPQSPQAPSSVRGIHHGVVGGNSGYYPHQPHRDRLAHTTIALAATRNQVLMLETTIRRLEEEEADLRRSQALMRTRRRTSSMPLLRQPSPNHSSPHPGSRVRQPSPNPRIRQIPREPSPVLMTYNDGRADVDPQIVADAQVAAGLQLHEIHRDMQNVEGHARDVLGRISRVEASIIDFIDSTRNLHVQTGGSQFLGPQYRPLGGYPSPGSSPSPGAGSSLSVATGASSSGAGPAGWYHRQGPYTPESGSGYVLGSGFGQGSGGSGAGPSGQSRSGRSGSGSPGGRGRTSWNPFKRQQ